MEHDIDELERQHEAAVSNSAQAHIRLAKAKERLFDARILQNMATLAERGILIGAKVSVRGGPPIGFAGYERGEYRTEEPRAHFTKIKSDGTVGKQRTYVYEARINDIEAAI